MSWHKEFLSENQNKNVLSNKSDLFKDDKFVDALFDVLDVLPDGVESGDGMVLRRGDRGCGGRSRGGHGDERCV